jgi:serine/threonine protein kinase/WD40 repeat protein
VGQRIGRFPLLKLLGHGGHSLVYLARDPTLGRDVAVKIPRIHLLESPSARARFLREARAIAVLRHANIVGVYETGEDRGIPYLVEEYCTGPNLAEWLQSQGESPTVPPAVAAQWLIALADATAHAHANRIIHRDLKPANVLLEPRHRPAGSSTNGARPYETSGNNTNDTSSWADDPGRFVPRITDFGIAKLFDVEDALTATKAILGTASYMAPEQAEGQGRDVGPTADVYSLGVILYELLTGRLPIKGESDIDTIRRLADEEPRAPRQIDRAIPRDIEAICLKCLEKNPRSRYPSARELKADLNRFLTGQPTEARRQSYVVRSIRRAQLSKFSSTSVLVGVLIVGLLAAGFGGIYWQARQKLGQKEQEQAVIVREQYADESRRADALLRQWAIGPQREPVVQQAQQILAKYIPEPGEKDLREFAWHYLASSLRPPTFVERRTIQAHDLAAYCVVFSPDGKRLATASADKTARVWDVETGQMLFSMSGHTGEVNSVAFSFDGEMLATAGEDGTVRLWNGADGASQGVLWKHSCEVTGVSFHPVADELVAVTQDGVMAIWSANTKHRVLVKKENIHHGKRIQGVAHSSNGGVLATIGQDGRLRLWEAANSYRPIAEHEVRWGEAVAVSPNGEFVAVGQEGPRRVSLYDGHGTGLVQDFKVPELRVRSLAFAGDEASLISTGFGTRLIDLPTGETWDPFPIRRDRWSIACSADGRRIAATGDQGVLEIFDGATRPRFHCSMIDFQECTWQNCAMSTDGRQLAIATSYQNRPGELVIWDVRGRSPHPTLTAKLQGNTNHPVWLSFSRDGSTLAISEKTEPHDGQIRLLDTTSGREKRRLTPCRGEPLRTCFNEDGSIVAAFIKMHNSLTFWSLGKDRPIDRIAIRDAESGFAVSHDGRVLAMNGISPTGDIDLIRMADRRRMTCAPMPMGFLPFHFTRDNQRLLAFDTLDRSLSIFDCGTGKSLRQFTIALIEDVATTGDIAATPDDQTLALGVGHAVVLVHAHSGKSMCRLDLPNSYTVSGRMMFSNDGRSLFVPVTSKNKRGLYVWRVAGAD